MASKLNKKKAVTIIQYLVLLLGLSVAAIIFQQTFSNVSRFLIIVVVAVLYVVWGYWHHGFHGRFDRMVFLEYSLVSLIVIMLAALGLGLIRFL